MRGLGLVAVLLCVALVLGITIAMAADTVLVKQHACMQDRDKQARSPAKANCSPPQFQGSALQVRNLDWFQLNLQWSPVTGPKRFKYQGHNYFYSGDVAPYKKIKYDWLDGRNFCRWGEGKNSALLSVTHQSESTVWTWFPWRPSGKMTTFKTG